MSAKYPRCQECGKIKLQGDELKRVREEDQDRVCKCHLVSIQPAKPSHETVPNKVAAKFKLSKCGDCGRYIIPWNYPEKIDDPQILSRICKCNSEKPEVIEEDPAEEVVQPRKRFGTGEDLSGSNRKRVGFFLIGGLILALVAAFAFYKPTPKADQKDQQNPIANAKPKGEMPLPEIRVALGQPAEVEPGHFIEFVACYGEINAFIYPNDLVFNQFAMREVKGCMLWYRISNSGNDGKIWNFGGFSEIGKITDEFGNASAFVSLAGMTDPHSNNFMVQLGNLSRRINPGEYTTAQLFFESLPQGRSKKFEVSVVYAGKRIIVSDDLGKDTRRPKK